MDFRSSAQQPDITQTPGAVTEAALPSPPSAATPSAGGSYLRDPITGELTLDTPSATQE